MRIIQGKSSREVFVSFLLSLLATAVLLLAFEIWINDYVAMPLRIISTTIAEFLLQLMQYDVIRHGTSLLIDGFWFNVDIACSGSQTLRMMLAVAVILVGLAPFVMFERFAALVFAIIIAVVINGIRVGALIFSCLYSGEVLGEDTFVHQFIGVIAYLSALFLFLKTCTLITKIKFLRFDSSIFRIIIACMLSVCLFLPFIYQNFLSWLGYEWNPYNKYGYIFVLIALALYSVCSYKELKIFYLCPYICRRDKLIFLVLISSGFGWTVLAVRLGFIAVEGIGLILLMLAWLGVIHSYKRLLFEFPVLLIFSLGLAKMPLFISNIIPYMGNYGWEGLFLFRLLVAAGVGCLYVFLKRHHGLRFAGNNRVLKSKDSGISLLTMYYFAVLIFLIVSMSWQVRGIVSDNEKSTVELQHVVDFPEQLGVWKLERLKLKEVTRKMLGGRGAGLLLYQSDYALPIEVLYNFSGGNRHNLHPPEYCFTGAGWEISEQKTLNFTGKNGDKFPITVMELSSGLERRWFAFWFYDGNKIYRNYLYMLSYDFLARLAGKQKNWAVYRIIAQRKEDLIIFLDDLFVKIDK